MATTPTGASSFVTNACSSTLRSLRPRNLHFGYPDQFTRSVPKCVENPQEVVDRDVKTEFGARKTSGQQLPERPENRLSAAIEPNVACWGYPDRERQWLVDRTNIVSKSVSVRRFRLNSRALKFWQAMSPNWIPVPEALSRSVFPFRARHGDLESSGRLLAPNAVRTRQPRVLAGIERSLER
jgi:hypothetical protein